jgi:hypothetical protein
MARSAVVPGPPQLGGGGSGNDRQERVLFEVYTPALAATKYFYDGEAQIIAYNRALYDFVFHIYSHWYQVWGIEDVFVTRPQMLNQPPFTNQLQQFLIEATNYIHLFGLVAYWTVENMEAYVAAYMNAANAVEREHLGLPFGILQPHEYTLKNVVPRDAASDHSGQWVLTPTVTYQEQRKGRPRARYHIYNHSAVFTPLDDELFAYTVLRMYNYLRNANGLQLVEIMNLDGTNLIQVPRSAFYKLQRESELLEEAKQNLWDADWQASHPECIFSQRLPDPDESGITEADGYDAESVRRAALGQRQQEAKYTLAHANQIIENAKRSVGLRRDARGKTPRQARQDRVNRPNQLDDAVVFDQDTTLLKADPARTLVDLAALQERYDANVRLQMGIDSDAMVQGWQWKRQNERKKDAFSVLPEMGDAGETPLIQVRQTLIQAIYRNIFFVAFGQYNVKLLSSTVALFDELKARAQHALAALDNHMPLTQDATPQQLVAALTNQPEGEDETETKQQARRTEIKRGVLQLAVRSFKVTRKKMKIMLAAMQQYHEAASARIVFERRQEGLVASKTAAFVSLAEKGLLARETLEKHLREVYKDTSIIVPEPLPDEAPAPRPAKRKREDSALQKEEAAKKRRLEEKD